ncbi:MAG: isochorismatase family protein [Bacteroidia bacterium]
MITALDKNTALVLIDLQKGIVQMDVIHPVKDILAKSAMMVQAFHKAGLPVVAVNVIPRTHSLRIDSPMRAAAMQFPPDFAELVEDLGTEPGDIFITKHTWNAFYNNSLHAELLKKGVTGIVLAGIATSIGVEATARAAHELGYNISFATDAMTDRGMDAHEHSMKNIFPRIGELGTTSDILAKL